ncbi:MAG: hypothetical protein HC771_21420 [Synechococcales cyanobacterium CRU_2_2]|nr:hypothetical protein [Synechococcales cyanobacterium CRU_2_2]
MVGNEACWAAEDDEVWWWPDPLGQEYWPEGVPREATLEVFVLAFATLSHQICEDANLEAGFQKLAIYVDAQGSPTHVARQLENGQWTSKLGSSEDIRVVAK